MAVYTVLTFNEMEELVAPFRLGRLTNIEGVRAGIENSTYFLTFTSSRNRQSRSEYVLTIAESITARDMRFVSQLTNDLQKYGLPVAAPIADLNNRIVIDVQGKPALLVPKIIGRPPVSPTPQQCHAIGKALAQLHLVTSQLVQNHSGHRSLAWVIDTGRKLLKHLPSLDRDLLEACLQDTTEFVSAHKNLPQAIIHGDLFRDNTLFNEGELVAIIDFFSAGTGYLIFDLAVIANDWCIDRGPALNTERTAALLLSYDKVRPLNEEEKCCWPNMLGIAALRFWVSRLADQVNPTTRGSTLLSPKDPNLYRQLVIAHWSPPVPGPVRASYPNI